MNTIRIYLAESGRIADLKKDFPLYQGQYQNKLLNVFVPTSILAPNFSVQQAGQTISDYVSSTAVKIGMRTVERNGKIYTSKTYYMRYLKTLTYQNVEYALYERKLPREFTFYAGQGQNAPMLIANVVNINNETSPATILDITTSQSCSLDVLPSNYLDKDEPIEASELERLTAELNEIVEQLVGKQDKEDESLETNNKYVVGAINENKRRIDDNVESISENSQSISQNRNDIDELKESVISGETYIGVMQLSSLPSSSQLNQFVLQEKGRVQRGGDSIIVSIMTDNDTDKNYKYIYNGSEWSYYEIPALGLSENGSFGAIKGTYAVGDTNNLLVDISGGKIVDIYVKNGDGNYLSIRQYLNQNSQNIEDIISGDIMVGEAVRAIEDEMGNDIYNTYLTKALGATKQFVRDYAQPREISEIFFISESGYSLSVPTTPPDGVQFQSQTNAVGSFPFFQIEKTNTSSFELSHQNGYSNVLHISASRDCEVSFRLTTGYKLLGEDWQTLNVELSNRINFTAEDVQRIQLSSLFASLGDNIVAFTPDTRIRQTLEIVSQESGFTTFKLYSNEIYPSTFSLTTQSYILGSIDQAKSQIIMIGADGIIESNNAVFTVLNPTNYIEYKTNQREFILNGHLPVVGSDISSLPIRITFGDTTYNLYSFMKGGNSPLTLGDIASSTTYNTNTGYSFDIRIMFIETSDITGFVLSPSTMTADQIVNLIGDDGSVNATVGADGKVVLVLDTAFISNPNLLINGDFRVNQRGKTSYTGLIYTIDRWQGSAYLTVTPQADGGVVLSSNGGQSYFVQRIEDTDALWGKTITMSFSVNGVVYSATGTLPSSKPSQGDTFITSNWVNGSTRARLYYYLSSKTLAFTFDINNNVTITIDYAKLEIGSVATAFSPRPYAEELALCQRYYVKLISPMLYGRTFNSDDTQGHLYCPLPTTLRTFKTITKSGTLWCFGNNSINEVTAISYGSNNINGLNLNATIATGIGTKQAITAEGSDFEIDCEIY